LQLQKNVNVKPIDKFYKGTFPTHMTRGNKSQLACGYRTASLLVMCKWSNWSKYRFPIKICDWLLAYFTCGV